MRDVEPLNKYEKIIIGTRKNKNKTILVGYRYSNSVVKSTTIELGIIRNQNKQNYNLKC